MPDSSIFGAGGLWNLLETQEASASPLIEFTSGINSSFKLFKILCTSVVMASDDQPLYVTASIDGGATYLGTPNYTFHNHSMFSGATTYSAAAGPSFSTVDLNGARALGNAANEGISAEITLFDPSNTSLYKHMHARAYYFDDGTLFGGTDIPFGVKTASAINAIKLNASGNIASGTFQLIAR